MKIISYILKMNIPFAVALLLIMATAVNTEELFLQSIKTNKQASDTLAAIDWSSNRASLAPWLSSVREKVALNGANIPLIPGAERITFDGGSAVRYRVSEPAGLVADFYRQALAIQGWQSADLASAKAEKLTIAYSENPLSGKTDITYAYAPADGARVLGVKIAEADTSAPAPDNQLPPPQEQLPPAPPSQPLEQQPLQQQPGQPLPDGQFQPQGPQPMTQPTTNQMDFSREPMPSGSNDQGEKQTCRVNGVEKPGSCDQYNNNQGKTEQSQTQPLADMCPNNTSLGCINNDGEFVASGKIDAKGNPVCPADSTPKCGNYQQNNQSDKNSRGRGGQMGQQGQSEQDQKRMEEEQKKMEERRFKDMKRGLSQFANGAKSMKRSIAKIKIAINKCGVSMPEELENALAQTDSLVAKINATKTADELDEIIGDIQDVGSVMQDWGPRIGDLSRLCQMFKQADRDAKQFDRDVKRLEAQVKANKKVDLSEPLAEYKTAISAQKEALAKAKELAKTDPEEALTKIEDEFYGNMDNLGNLRMQIEAIVNMTRGISNITRELNTFASQIKSLARKKVDVTAMQELLATLKTKVAEIKDLLKNKADAEELIGKIEEAFDVRQELQDALQENDMINTMPKVGTGSAYNVKVNLPESFRKAEKNDDDDQAGEEIQFKQSPAGPNGGSGFMGPRP